MLFASSGPLGKPVEGHLGRLGDLLDRLGAIFALLEAFGRPGTLLAASLGPLGGLLGLYWGSLGVVLGPSRAVLGPCVAVLGTFLAVFGPLWEPLWLLG